VFFGVADIFWLPQKSDRSGWRVKVNRVPIPGSIGLINSDNLVILKFWNSTFELKYYFSTNLKKMERSHVITYF